QRRGDTVFCGCFPRVFGDGGDRTGEQRSGVGTVPALRRIGATAILNRDRYFLRALTGAPQEGQRSTVRRSTSSIAVNSIVRCTASSRRRRPANGSGSAWTRAAYN